MHTTSALSKIFSPWLWSRRAVLLLYVGNVVGATLIIAAAVVSLPESLLARIFHSAG